MNFNLGLVGHPDINLRIKKIIEEHFKGITLHLVNVTDERDLEGGVKRIRGISRICHGILYSARALHYLFNNRLDHFIPNIYIEGSKGSIYRALLQGNYHMGKDIKKVSVDSLSYREMSEVYWDLGINPREECSIKIVKPSYTQKAFIEEVISHHLKNHRYDNSLCITQISNVRDSLGMAGVETVLIEPQREQIIEGVNNLIYRGSSERDNNSDQVAITINISNLKENLIINSSHHSVVLEYNRIMEEVFWFAERVEGAYSSNGSKSYTIFCNRKAFEYETRHFSKLSILDSIGENQVVYASIGVGYGRNFKEAIKHSVIASIRASKERRNSAYVAYEAEKLTGPLLPSNDPGNHSSIVFDSRLEHIASSSSINIDTIYRINSALKECNNYTSSEVAQIIGVTRRSANRIIEKLEEGGFVECICKKSNGRRGRPSRIVRFLF